jgi:hypothetical protein
LSLSFKNKTRTCCSCRGGEDGTLSTSSAYAVLGVQPDCSPVEIKAAFRAKVPTPSINIYSPFPFTLIQVSSPLIFNLLHRWSSSTQTSTEMKILMLWFAV